MAYYDNEYIDDCSGVSQPHAMRGCCFNANIGTCRHSDDKGNGAHATQQRTQRGQSRCSIPGTWLHVITQPRHTCCKQESGAMPAAQRAPCWRQTRRGCYCHRCQGLATRGPSRCQRPGLTAPRRWWCRPPPAMWVLLPLLVLTARRQHWRRLPLPWRGCADLPHRCASGTQSASRRTP